VPRHTGSIDPALAHAEAMTMASFWARTLPKKTEALGLLIHEAISIELSHSVACSVELTVTTRPLFESRTLKSADSREARLKSHRNLPLSHVGNKLGFFAGLLRWRVNTTSVVMSRHFGMKLRRASNQRIAPR
jgi:hypothetical protein